MQVVIVNDGHRLSRAYPASLLAGIAGFDDAADLMDAARRDDGLLAKAASACDVLDAERGRGDVAVDRLKARLVASGHEVVATPDDQRQAIADADFKTSYQAAMGAVLLQAKRASALRQKMTMAAVTLATSVALTLSSGVATPVHAGDVGKNLIGAGIGAALGSKIGDGRGRKVAIAVGAVAGYVVANGIQNSASNPPVQPQSLVGPAPALPAGGAPLEPEKQARLQELERGFTTTRGAYALSLYKQLQANDEWMLNRNSKDAAQALQEADKVVAKALQDYAHNRGEFVNAVEYLGKRGYDMHDYALQHATAYSNITARDLPRMEMQGAAVQRPQQQPQLVEAGQYNP